MIGSTRVSREAVTPVRVSAQGKNMNEQQGEKDIQVALPTQNEELGLTSGIHKMERELTPLVL